MTDFFTQAAGDIQSNINSLGADASAMFNVPATDATLTGDNTGTNIDYSAGAAGGTPLTNPTGNSFLDSLASISSIAGKVVNSGLQAYSSFLNTSNIIKQQQKGGVISPSGTAVTGTIPTVPATASASRTTGIYIAVAVIGGIVLLKFLKK